MLPPQALAHNFLKQDAIFQAFGVPDDNRKIPDISSNCQSVNQMQP